MLQNLPRFQLPGSPRGILGDLPFFTRAKTTTGSNIRQSSNLNDITEANINVVHVPRAKERTTAKDLRSVVANSPAFDGVNVSRASLVLVCGCSKGCSCTPLPIFPHRMVSTDHSACVAAHTRSCTCDHHISLQGKPILPNN